MIGIKAIWKSLYMTVKFLHEYLQPTFYAEHAVALSWFSLAAPKYLLGKIHFPATLSKNTSLRYKGPKQDHFQNGGGVMDHFWRHQR